MKVKEVMSKKMHCCIAADSCEHAAQQMNKFDVGSLPVVESLASNKLIGTITDRDICLHVVGEGKSPSTPVGSVMTKSLITCNAEDSVLACESLMQRHQLRRIPVIDARGYCVGIVAQADIAIRDDAEHVKRTVSAISKQKNSHVIHPPVRADEALVAR